jgi:hypothetical protein
MQSPWRARGRTDEGDPSPHQTQTIQVGLTDEFLRRWTSYLRELLRPGPRELAKLLVQLLERRQPEESPGQEERDDAVLDLDR